MRQRLGVLVVVWALFAAAPLLADDHGGSGGTELKGIVTALPAGGGAGDWTIGGRTVHVSTATRIETEGGVPAVGSLAEVKGTTRADGSIDATELEIRASGAGAPPQEVHIVGTVDALPSSGLVGDWTVGGRVVHVTSSTRIEAEHGAPAKGDTVEVEGTALADGSIAASSVEVRGADDGGGVPPQAPPQPAEAEIKGAVEVLSADPQLLGDWTVAGVTVHVTAATRIRTDERTLALGSIVEIKGTRRADGSIDAARVEVTWGPATSGGAHTTVKFLPSTARAAGRGGAFFTTSVTLSSRASAPVEVEILFHGHDRDGRDAAVRTLTLAPQETRTIDDVLGTLFGVGRDFGSMSVRSNSGALVVSSRTSTPGGGGAFGQDVPAAGREDLVREGAPRVIAGVRDDRSVRTNLVVANAGPIDTDVEVELEGPDGSPIAAARLSLRPLEMRQINDVARALAAPAGFRDARLRISTPTANGALAAYAAEIDNGTNDPRTLWPR